MKGISGSIVVLAGAVVFSAGVLTGHADTQLFVCSIGGLLTLAGLFAWLVGLSRQD